MAYSKFGINVDDLFKSNNYYYSSTNMLYSQKLGRSITTIMISKNLHVYLYQGFNEVRDKNWFLT